MDHIVIDVEIQKTIEETPGGWSATDRLGVAVAVVYEYISNRFRIYGDQPDDLHALQQRLLRADKISGFNIYKFDYNVIFKFPGASRVTHLLPKTNDILRRIWLAKGLNPDSFGGGHKGWGLDNVVKGTLPGAPGKIANGAIAPVWYKAGEWGKVANYCLDDVSLERDLVDFVDKNGYVIRGDTGEKLVIPPLVISKVDTSPTSIAASC
jgi:hypothetical protein